MPRINYRTIAPAALKALLGIDQFVRQSGLEHSLYELVKIRASYQNGCAYCLDMHTKEARLAGETEQRIYGVPVWRETPYFSPRERAALAWTEAVTKLGEHGVPDALFREVREHFSEQETIALTMAVISINAWNRLAVPLGDPSMVGTYDPKNKLQIPSESAAASA
jgi:AhpD family alkylhydroperoxidase